MAEKHRPALARQAEEHHREQGCRHKRPRAAHVGELLPIAEVKGEAENQQHMYFAYVQEMLKMSPDAGALEYVAVALVDWNAWPSRRTTAATSPSNKATWRCFTTPEASASNNKKRIETQWAGAWALPG